MSTVDNREGIPLVIDDPVDRLSQLLSNSDTRERLATFLENVGREEEEVDEEENFLDLSDCLVGTLADVKENLVFLYRQGRFNNPESGTRYLAGGVVTLPPCDELSTFMGEFQPGRKSYQLSSDIHLKMLKKMYKPMFEQILESTFFEKSDLKALKTASKETQQKFESFHHEEERSLFLVRILQCYFYLRYTGTDIQKLDTLVSHALLYAGHISTLVADKRKAIIAKERYDEDQENGSTVEKNKAWTSAERERMQRDYELRQISQISDIRDTIIGSFKKGRGRGRAGRGRGANSTHNTPTSTGFVHHGGRGRGRGGRGRGGPPTRFVADPNGSSGGGAEQAATSG